MARLGALAGVAAGSAALIHDLGKPGAFPEHAANRQTHVADVDGHLDPRDIRSAGGAAAARRDRRACCRAASRSPVGSSSPAPALPVCWRPRSRRRSPRTPACCCPTPLPRRGMRPVRAPLCLRGVRRRIRRGSGDDRHTCRAGGAGSPDGSGRGAGRTRHGEADGAEHGPQRGDASLRKGETIHGREPRAHDRRSARERSSSAVAIRVAARGLRCGAVRRLGLHPVRHLRSRPGVGARPPLHGDSATRTPRRRRSGGWPARLGADRSRNPHPAQVTVHSFGDADPVEVLEQRHGDAASRAERLAGSGERERLRQLAQPLRSECRRGGQQGDVPGQGAGLPAPRPPHRARAVPARARRAAAVRARRTARRWSESTSRDTARRGPAGVPAHSRVCAPATDVLEFRAGTQTSGAAAAGRRGAALAPGRHGSRRHRAARPAGGRSRRGARPATPPTAAR